jgi:UDP-glucose 4-epimerase
MNVLVTGGAGYIGSHMVKRLIEVGHRVTVLDNLSTGHGESVLASDFVRDDLCSPHLDEVFRSRAIDVVMHFAALIQVGDSVREPAAYYRNNVSGTLNLLDAMMRSKVRRMVFSSTAAVYGVPQGLPIREEHPKSPINPYGATKWMIEQALAHYRDAYGLQSLSLRYFNAAGADPGGQLGPRHARETHLIPLVVQAASGRGPALTLFGEDYPTRDGTCLRDFVHVTDLCEAHLLAVDALERGYARPAYNLGSGRGFTVREVIDAAARIARCPVPVRVMGRREGDPACLLADSTAARTELAWRPTHSTLDAILRDAWSWELKQLDPSRSIAPVLETHGRSRGLPVHAY